MIAVGKFAFNDNDVQYVWWADKPRQCLIIEFYEGGTIIVNNPEVANAVWHYFVNHKTWFDSKPGEVEWLDGSSRVRGNPRV